MTTHSLTLPDGSTLTLKAAHDGNGPPRGIDSVTSRTLTYMGDDDGGRLVDADGANVREVRKRSADARTAGRKSSSRSPDGSRWATLNTFVDLLARHLSPVEIAVWLVLYRDCRGSTVEASQRNLAVRSGASERSVVRAMRRLREIRLIEVVKASKSRGEASRYRLEGHPERCLDALGQRPRTGDTTAPVQANDDHARTDKTGATMAPVGGTNR
jgi:hypothetical protein